MAGERIDANLQEYYRKVIKTNPLYLSHQFVVEFYGSALPDEFNLGHDTKSITYYVKSSRIPNVQIAEQTVSFLGQDFVLPKVVQHAADWEVQIYAMNDLYHYNALRAWCEKYADIRRNGGGDKRIPDIQARVQLLDNTMQRIQKTFVLEGVFPSKVPDLSMQYENNAAIPDCAITFTYQYLYDDMLDDPLRTN